MSQIEDVFAFNKAAQNGYKRGKIDWTQLARAVDHCHEEFIEEMIPAYEELLQLRGGLEDGEVPITTHVDAVVNVADAALDLMYVAINVLHALGVPADRLWNEVQRANMAKIGPDGTVLRRADGKILKPDGWTPPKLFHIVLEDYR